MHRSKKYLSSITSSAVASSVGGTLRSSALLFHPIYSDDVVLGEAFANLSDGLIFR